jgi:hypothetical protein
MLDLNAGKGTVNDIPANNWESWTGVAGMHFQMLFLWAAQVCLLVITLLVSLHNLPGALPSPCAWAGSSSPCNLADSS